MGQLQNKVALILGASSSGGIGEATASRFVAEGARVIVSARREQELEALAKSVGATPMTCDMTDEAQLESLVARAHAIARSSRGARDRRRRARRSAHRPTHARSAAGDLRDQRDRGRDGDQARGTCDGCGCVDHLRVLRRRLAEHVWCDGVRMHQSGRRTPRRGCRTRVREPRHPRQHAATGDAGHVDVAGGARETGRAAAFERETPLGRLATVVEVAAAATWLASDGCYTTGDRIRVGGGVHLRRHPMPGDIRD